MVLAVIAAIAAALCVSSIVVAVAWPGENQLAIRLRAFQSSTSSQGDDDSTLKSSTSKSIIYRSEERLASAGNPAGLTAPIFFTIQVGLSLGLPFLLLWPYLLQGLPVSAREIVYFFGLALLGSRLPEFWLSKKVSARRKQIEKLLPDALDLITVCVEAGLSVDSALQRVTEKWHGPLSDEIRQTLSEMNLGRPRREALRELGHRAGVQDLNAFIVALIQAEQMGVSVGRILRVQAAQSRQKRRQRAEQAAQKAPVKMLIPLVLFIFPAMFVVIIGPAMIALQKTFAQ